MDRRDFQELARIRLKEAKALFSLGLNDGAYYLAGYVVECALKACIAKRTQRYEFPDKKRADGSHTHNLRELVRVAAIEKPFAEALKDEDFKENWEVVRAWSELSRYAKHNRDSAGGLLAAIADRRHGILTWLRLYY